MLKTKAEGKYGQTMRPRWLTLFLVAGLAAGAGYYYWQQSTPSKLDIQTVAAKKGDVRRVVSTSGTVSALISVDIGSQLSGNISEVNVDYSTEVKKDQVLARIEPSTFETRVRQGEAAVAVAKANVALQQAAVERAEANLHKAELDLHRAQELVARGAGAQVTLDTALAAQQSGQADLDSAKANLENAKANVTMNEATLESARIDLERTYIRAPLDGVIIDRTVQVGQTVAASLSSPKLFTMAQDLAQVQIQAQVDEADIGQVTSDNTVTFTVDAYPDVKFEGKVQQIRLAPVSLANVVTYTVVIGADNPMGRLLPGMTANVSIIVARKDNVIQIKNAALRYRPAEAAPAEMGSRSPAPGAGRGAGRREQRPSERTVYVLSGSRPTPVQIKTGISDGVVTEVVEGLKEGDRVVTAEMPTKSQPASTPANPFSGGRRFP